jgi:hypothetical protein
MTFIYQAPTGLQENKNITVTVAQDQTAERLLVNQPAVVPKIVQTNIIVAKGTIKVLSGESDQELTEVIFDLPKDESDIQYIDTESIAQIHSGTIPKFTITVQDKNGNKLDTVANIVSKEGLLSP